MLTSIVGECILVSGVNCNDQCYILAFAAN